MDKDMKNALERGARGVENLMGSQASFHGVRHSLTLRNKHPRIQSVLIINKVTFVMERFSFSYAYCDVL